MQKPKIQLLKNRNRRNQELEIEKAENAKNPLRVERLQNADHFVHRPDFAQHLPVKHKTSGKSFSLPSAVCEALFEA